MSEDTQQKAGDDLLVRQSVYSPIGGRRTPAQKEMDLELISHYYLRGFTSSEITSRLNNERPYTISLYTVREDLKTIRNRWRDGALESYNEVMHRELERLDMLEGAHWKAWEKSLKDYDEESVEVTEDSTISPGKTGDRVVGKKKRRRGLKETKKGKGDIRHLEAIERIVKMRLQIFGIMGQGGSTLTVNVDWRKQAQDSGMDTEVIDAVFEQAVAGFIEVLDGDDEIGGDEGGEEAS